MTFICTYCGEFVEDSGFRRSDCPRCGEPRLKDKQGRAKDRKEFMKECGHLFKNNTMIREKLMKD